MTFTQHYYVTGNWIQHTFEIGPSKITTRASVTNLAVFPRIWVCFFCGFAVFWGDCGLLVFGFVLIEICLFFGLVFRRFLFCGLLFFKFYGTFAVSIYCVRHIGRVFMKICSFWACFFQICLPAFLFNFLADFSFCWIFPPTRVGLVFRLNYRFLTCFSSLRVCFCKITWHHWLAVAARGENGRECCEISSLVEHTGLSPCPWLFIMAFPVTPAVLNLSN